MYATETWFNGKLLICKRSRKSNVLLTHTYAHSIITELFIENAFIKYICLYFYYTLLRYINVQFYVKNIIYRKHLNIVG